MSGLYIPNMTLPENNNWKTIRIYKNGEVAYPNWQGDCTFANTHAIPVPDHGDLIDRDAIFNSVKFPFNSFTVANGERVVSCDYLNAAPTVIPASGGDSK